MPKYKYICLECGHLFNEPYEYSETHGFGAPPYEELSGCPVCGGSYDEAVECDDCGELFPFSTGHWLNSTTLICSKCKTGRYEAGSATSMT